MKLNLVRGGGGHHHQQQHAAEPGIRDGRRERSVSIGSAFSRGVSGAADIGELAQDAQDRVAAKVACGKVLSILEKMEAGGHLTLETSSVYGGVIALPQIARSSGWGWSLTCLALRSYMLLFVNVVLQSFLLSMIGTEQLIMYPFAGQMHLCNFGAAVAACVDPTSSNCIGPGGTRYSYPRLYDYDIWGTRSFAKQSLQALFPKLNDEINVNVDPGEYGQEDSWCRAVCILIFVITIANDLKGTIDMGYLLWKVPSRAESWITYEIPSWGDTKEEVKLVMGWSELDFVRYRIAGMPRIWKVVNFVLVLVPKFMLWNALCLSGVHYLMETAGIVDVVVNAMALTFILDVDEMIFGRLGNAVLKHMMSCLEDMPLFDLSGEEEKTDAEILHKFQATELGRARIWKALDILPTQLFLVLGLQGFFMWVYYMRNCQQLEDGSWVSKPIHEPQLTGDLLALTQLMFGIEPPELDSMYWKMPK